MRVALVHDYLTQRGGAERVVLSMLKAFPKAPLYTSLYLPDGTYDGFAQADVRVSPLNAISLFRRNHRLAFPLLAPLFSSLSIDADVVLCSSSGWAHGIRTRGKKVVYCYAPGRWLYQRDRYLGPNPPLAAKASLVMLSPLLKRWDRWAALSSDRCLTLSRAVRDQIRSVYGIDAEVVPPPPTLDSSGPQAAVRGLAPGFFLGVARLLPYKNVERVIDAVRALDGIPLVIVGTGPERERLRALATSGTTFLSNISEQELRWLYANCVGVIGASHEDYGLTPLEGASFGKPAAVLHGGGYLDTVVAGRTGVFFGDASSRSIAGALHSLISTRWSSASIKAHARRFSEEEFIRRLQMAVQAAAE